MGLRCSNYGKRRCYLGCLVSQTEHLPTKWFGNPKASLPLKVIQDGANGSQQASVLGLK